MRKLLIFLSGARPDVLAQCPSENPRFRLLGGTVLLGGAVLSAGTVFALTELTGLSVDVAVVIAGVIGLSVLSLDRALVTATMTLSGRIVPALIRVLIGALFGLFIASALIIAIVRPQIDAQIILIKQHNASAFAEEQSTDSLGRQIATLQKEYDTLQHIRDTQGSAPLNPNADPTLILLTDQLREVQTAEQKAYEQLNCQLYGVPVDGQTCQAGNGISAHNDEITYERDEQQANQLQGEITNRTQQLLSSGASADQARLSDANKELPGVELELRDEARLQANQSSVFNAANQADNGPMIKLQALTELGDRDTTIRAATLALLTITALVSCLPVVLRVFQGAGNYERVLAVMQRQEVLRAQRSLRVIGPTTLEQVLDQEPVPVGPNQIVWQVLPDDEDEALRGMPDMRAAGYPGDEQAVRRQTTN
jgi:Domain of unknown function (DUF4407)